MSKKEIDRWSLDVAFCALNADDGTEEFWFFDLWRVELNAAWYGYRLS